MLDSIYHMAFKLFCNLFCCENVKILSYMCDVVLGVIVNVTKICKPLRYITPKLDVIWYVDLDLKSTLDVFVLESVHGEHTRTYDARSSLSIMTAFKCTL